MNPTFETLVEQVRARSTEEKEELKSILDRSLIEERRLEIRANHRRSQDELKRGRLKFSSSISELKKVALNATIEVALRSGSIDLPVSGKPQEYGATGKSF
jgi:hypothetical protein